MWEPVINGVPVALLQQIPRAVTAAPPSSVTFPPPTASVLSVVDRITLPVITEAVVGALNKGHDIQLVGFGSWAVQQRNAREGRNPKTGETVDIPAKNAIKLIVSGHLKDLINKD